MNPTPQSAATGDRSQDPSGEDAMDLGRQGLILGFLIHDVSRMRRSIYDQLVRPLGFTRAKWWVLAHLARHDGMTQSQLADVLEVGRASLGDLIESLEREGLVERRHVPSDRRAKCAFLTEQGRTVVQVLSKEERRFNLKVLSSITPQECSELIRLLSLMKSSVKEIEKAGEASLWKQLLKEKS